MIVELLDFPACGPLPLCRLHRNEPGCVEGEHRHVREGEEEAKDGDAARILFPIRACMHAMCSITMSTSMFDN